MKINRQKTLLNVSLDYKLICTQKTHSLSPDWWLRVRWALSHKAKGCQLYYQLGHRSGLQFSPSPGPGA